MKTCSYILHKLGTLCSMWWLKFNTWLFYNLNLCPKCSMLIFNVDTIIVQSLNNVKWVNDCCFNSNPAILRLMRSLCARPTRLAGHLTHCPDSDPAGLCSFSSMQRALILVFGFPMIYRTRCQHANHYTTDTVHVKWKVVVIDYTN